MVDVSKEKWGFLRETAEAALKAGPDADTGLKRTGLEEYLHAIFPEVSDWVHDRVVDTAPKEKRSRRRPDFRSESLKLIVEFDVLPHYQTPEAIKRDEEGTAYYEGLGYKVVRIPFFIQLTNRAVEQLFGVKVEEPLFNEAIPSMGVKGITPVRICGAGILRMARDFKRFPEQYAVNRKALLAANDECLTGANLLELVYRSL